MDKKKEITVFHLHFKKDWLEDFPNLEKLDFFFGSIAAIYEKFTAEEIGIQASSLYNYKLDVNTNPYWENDICKIRKDVLITKKHKASTL
jgi:hypothetical protein